MLDPHHPLPAATTRETSEKDYTPAKDEDGPVAMLWELLRRNPRFKATFAKFKAIAHRGTSEGIRSASQAVRKIAAFNPFAAYTLIWIFAPKFVEFEGYRRQVNYRKDWTVAADGEQLDPNERPSEAFDRHEVVMLMGEAPGATARKVFKIVRTDAGGFFALTEWEGLPLDEFQGRFVQLLAPKPATPELIEVARAILAVKGLNEQKLRGSPRRQ